MKKHTPGPWKVEHYCGHPHIEIWGEGGKLRIAYLQDHVAENETNSTLIAAAPELLAALQWIVDCGDGCPTAIDMVEAMRHHAREAIAKAEGKVTK